MIPIKFKQAILSLYVALRKPGFLSRPIRTAGTARLPELKSRTRQPSSYRFRIQISNPCTSSTPGKTNERTGSTLRNSIAALTPERQSPARAGLLLLFFAARGRGSSLIILLSESGISTPNFMQRWWRINTRSAPLSPCLSRRNAS